MSSSFGPAGQGADDSVSISWVTQPAPPPGAEPPQRGTSGQRDVLIIVAILVAVVIVGSGVGWYVVHRGSSSSASGDTSPKARTASPRPTPRTPPPSPPPSSPTVGPRNLGAKFILPHFTVQAIRAYEEGENYAVRSRVCVRATQSGETIRVSAAAWSVLAGSQEFDADAAAGTYKKVMLRVGQCNEGWLVFHTGGRSVTQILYHNSLEEAAAW